MGGPAGTVTGDIVGALRTVAVWVAEDRDLSKVEGGDEVHAAYAESLAVSVQRAKKQ